MSTNKLKPNQDKTEFILFCNSIHRNKMLVNSITVCESNTSSSKYIRNLGVYLDQEFSIEKHMNQLCKSCYFQLRNIRYIRSSLTTEASKIVVHALVMSKLHFCNSILFGISNKLLDKLQRVQNCAAKLVLTSNTGHQSSPECLKTLHWLPIKYWIQYKILLLVFKSTKGFAPPYRQDLLRPHKNERLLRSSSKHLLTVPKSKLKTFGDRAFSVCGPKLWNDLTNHVKTSASTSDFKKKLKTHFFNCAFKQ